MVSLREHSELSPILHMKGQYLRSLMAPMDGMWEVGFINSAPHWEITKDGKMAGYCAIDREGTLLQYYLRPEFEKDTKEIFKDILELRSIKRAIVNTIDPSFLSLCLDYHSKLSVHSYIYGHQSIVKPEHPKSNSIHFRTVEIEELDRVVALQVACLGGNDALVSWLRSYTTNLISRQELFVLSNQKDWIGLGEYRRSETQDDIVDVGMMVSPSHRKQGWATFILCLLVDKCVQLGHFPICSTTVENKASQKAISRAGFVSRNRILSVSF